MQLSSLHRMSVRNYKLVNLLCTQKWRKKYMMDELKKGFAEEFVGKTQFIFDILPQIVFIQY